MCEDCGNEFGSDQYANVMSCSSKKIADFVSWVQQQDFYENTTIVLAGDHPTMDSDFCEDVKPDYVRKVYTVYINPAAEVQKKDMYREYTTFDHYPTTLASLGVKIEGERLGLGTNLFSDEWTLTEKYQRSWVESELNKKSKFMEDLTSYIEVEEEEPEEAVEEQVPEALITVGEYDGTAAVLPVLISDIRNVQSEIVAMNVAVWTAEDQSDLQWAQAWKNEEGNYVLDISTANFGYQTGEYHIDVYGVMGDGSMVLLGGVRENLNDVEAENELL